MTSGEKKRMVSVSACVCVSVCVWGGVGRWCVMSGGGMAVSEPRAGTRSTMHTIHTMHTTTHLDHCDHGKPRNESRDLTDGLYIHEVQQ